MVQFVSFCEVRLFIVTRHTGPVLQPATAICQLQPWLALARIQSQGKPGLTAMRMYVVSLLGLVTAPLLAHIANDVTDR